MSRPQAEQSGGVAEVSSGSGCREFGQTQAVATHLDSSSEQQLHLTTDSQIRMERQTEHQSQRGACLDAADVVQTNQRVQERSHTTGQTSVLPVGRGRQRIHLPRHDRLQQQQHEQQQAGASSTAAVNSCRHAFGQLQDVQVVSATQAEPATQAVPATEAEQPCATVSVQSASNDQAAECAGAGGVQSQETMRPGCQQPPGLNDASRQLAESQLHQQPATQHAAQHAHAQQHSQHAQQQHAQQQQQHSQHAQQQHSQHAQQQCSQHAQHAQQSQHAQHPQHAQQPAVQDLQAAAQQQQQPVREHHQQPAAATLPRTAAKGCARDQQPAIAPTQLDCTRAEAAGGERDEQQPIMPALASSSSACEPPGAVYHRPAKSCTDAFEW